MLMFRRDWMLEFAFIRLAKKPCVLQSPWNNKRMKYTEINVGLVGNSRKWHEISEIQVNVKT